MLQAIVNLSIMAPKNPLSKNYNSYKGLHSKPTDMALYKSLEAMDTTEWKV